MVTGAETAWKISLAKTGFSVALRFTLQVTVLQFVTFILLASSCSSLTSFPMQSWLCPIPTCKKICHSPGGLTQHLNRKHHHNENFGKREKAIHRTPHPILDGWSDLTFPCTPVLIHRCRHSM